MATLLIADDHPIFLRGLHGFLSSRGHDVLTCAQTTAAAFEWLEHGRVDAIIVDVSMPGGGGLDLLSGIRNAGRLDPVIFLTVGIDARGVAEALQLGLNGLVLKTADPGDLLECIAAVLIGESWYDASVMRDLKAPTPSSHPRMIKLSAREREVAGMVARGLRNRDIAELTALTEGTVKIHIHNIFRKLSLDSRAQLILMMNEDPH